MRPTCAEVLFEVPAYGMRVHAGSPRCLIVIDRVVRQVSQERPSVHFDRESEMSDARVVESRGCTSIERRTAPKSAPPKRGRMVSHGAQASSGRELLYSCLEPHKKAAQ